MKTLSIQRPRPSIEILIPAAASAPVKAGAGELRALIRVENLRTAAVHTVPNQWLGSGPLRHLEYPC